MQPKNNELELSEAKVQCFNQHLNKMIDFLFVCFPFPESLINWALSISVSSKLYRLTDLFYTYMTTHVRH